MKNKLIEAATEQNTLVLDSYEVPADNFDYQHGVNDKALLRREPGSGLDKTVRKDDDNFDAMSIVFE
jgi:hypothetical protein